MLWHDRRTGCNDPGAHQIQRDRLASDASLPILIFVAATVVVTISTMHIIFTRRGFFEVSIWLFAISQVMPTRERPIASRQEPCLPYLSNLRSGGARLRYFESIAGRHRVIASVDGRAVWSDSPDTPLAATAEAYGSALLVPAMHAGRPLRLADPVSETWGAHLAALTNEWRHLWYPAASRGNRSCNGISVSAGKTWAHS